jgi:hypothetical protein
MNLPTGNCVNNDVNADNMNAHDVNAGKVNAQTALLTGRGAAWAGQAADFNGNSQSCRHHRVARGRPPYPQSRWIRLLKTAFNQVQVACMHGLFDHLPHFRAGAPRC